MYSSNREGYQVIRTLTNEMLYSFNFSYKDMVGHNPKNYFGVIGDEDNPFLKK